MRRQYSGTGGVTPNSKVIPLQGVGLPPSYYSQPQAMKLSAPGLPGAPSSGASPSSAAAAPSIPPADKAPAAVPGNPPIDVSQHMMDALDKYMRLQQQRDSGSQVDVVH
jgi:hypothetical protein